MNKKLNDNDSGLLDQVVLGEISGKNNAIHAYDKIIWTIRSGYLTLVFVGWSLILKSSAESTISSTALMKPMLLLTLGLSIGGWIIDMNFTRRKFRVILCLNALISAVKDANGMTGEIPTKLLMVAGDDGEAKYHSSGYRQASLAGAVVYFCTLLTLVLAVLVFNGDWTYWIKH